MVLVERKACSHAANALFSRLDLIWPISWLKISKMFKNVFSAKSSSSQWVKICIFFVFLSSLVKHVYQCHVTTSLLESFLRVRGWREIELTIKLPYNPRVNIHSHSHSQLARSSYMYHFSKSVRVV